MPGTFEGGKKAAATNKARFGEDFYVHIGTKGGSISTTGGFASKKIGKDGLTGYERARKCGSVGGKMSSRKGIKNGQNRMW